MSFLDLHIITEAELRRRIEEAREEQRQLENAIVKRLLHNSEKYRKRAIGRR